jgi:hypothetical protein
MRPAEHGGGGHVCLAPATETDPEHDHHHRSHERCDRGQDSSAGTAPPDSDEAIRALLGAEDTVLAGVLRHDRAVRHALRDSLPHHPADADLEAARTLCAVARVERRRRHRSTDLLRRVLSAARGEQ